MIPGNALSVIPEAGEFIPPDEYGTGPFLDHERGGVALYDASQGLRVKDWSCYLSGGSIVVKPEDGVEIPIIAASGVDWLSFAFDQNMNPVLAYVSGGNSYLRWFDGLTSTFVTTNFGSGIRCPRLSLDDKRATQVDNRSDVIFAYLKGDKLCYRQQRDRYDVEYVLGGGFSNEAKLNSFGMGKNFRLLFDVT